jgi:hypothetical protein
MLRRRRLCLVRTSFQVVCLCFLLYSVPAASQETELPEPADHGQHSQHAHHHLHMPLGEEKCSPTFTYDEGPLGPSHWPGLCTTGKMQAPIDILQAEKLQIYDLEFNYQATDLDVINDCNQYRILVKFPDNYWLTVGKKPYFLTELHFRVPGENAIKGKRPRMSVQLVHLLTRGSLPNHRSSGGCRQGKPANQNSLGAHSRPGEREQSHWGEDQSDGSAARRPQLLSISGIADHPHLQ